MKKEYFRYLGIVMWILPFLWFMGEYFSIFRALAFGLVACIYFATADFLTKLEDNVVDK